uniref:Nicastrin n=1 Tax=Angiostrongylus cantonensis TaxID=6313 RepID=A0A158P8U2_ANGCA
SATLFPISRFLNSPFKTKHLHLADFFRTYSTVIDCIEIESCFIDVYGGDCSSTNPWNEQGYILSEGLRNIDWNIQILYMENQTHISQVKKCHDVFNVPKNGSSVSFPFCAASFGVFNTGAGSTEICYRRSKPSARLFDLNIESRDPLVGVNVMLYLPPKFYNETAVRSSTRYLMLSSRLDSFGLIPEISPGEISVVTSIIALLAVARAIGQHFAVFERAAYTSDRHVIIAFFDGESFDYIGSSDVSYDMMKGEFPRKPRSDIKTQLDPIITSQLDGLIELQQLGTGNGRELNAHADGSQVRTERYIRSKLNLLDSKMPPSSWYSFERSSPSIRGIVLAPFRKKYEYSRINSMLDRVQWNATQRSTAFSEVIIAASAVLRAAMDHVRLPAAQKPTIKIDSEFCFIDSSDWFSCEFFNRINGGRFKPSSEFYSGKSTYVSAGYRNPIRFFVEWLAIYATGSTAHTSNVKDKKTCDDLGKDQNVYLFTWQADPITGTYYCYRTSMIVHQVNSPAFRIDGVVLFHYFSNGTYSTWTESLYNIENLQLYLVEEESFEKVMLCLGVALALISFLVINTLFCIVMYLRGRHGEDIL